MVNRLLFKLMFRELRKNAVSYLSMFLITLLAVTLFLGFLSNSFTLSERAELYYEEVNVADLIVQTSSFDEDDKTCLESLSSQTEYRVYSDGSFQRAGIEAETAEIYIGDPSINVPYVTKGEEGFLIDALVAENKGYEVGDKVTLRLSTFSGAFETYGIPETLEFTITGFMHCVDRVSIYSVSPVYLTTQTLREAIIGATSYPEAVVDLLLEGMQNQAVIKSDNAAELKIDIENYFARKEDSNLIFVYDHDTMESIVTIDSEVDQSLSMIYVFPVIFFFVALLVIMTTISRLILRERTNIGTMKALGIGNGRIVFHYAALSGFITLIGCIAGAVAGPLIIPEVMGIKYTLMFSMPSLCGTVWSIPFTVITVLFVCLCACLIGVWASLSVIGENPASCMRPKEIAYRGRAKEKKKKSKAVSHGVLSCRMAFRNILVSPGRALMTAVGIIGCTALLVTSFGIGDTLSSSITNDLGGLFTYDVSSSYSSSQEEEVFAILDGYVEDGTAEHYEKVHSYAVSLKSTAESVSVWVFEEGSLLNELTVHGNTLSKNKAEEFDLSVGDELVLSAGGQTVTFTIDYIAETSIWNGFFTTDNALSGYAYASESVWVKTGSAAEVKDGLNEINGTLAAQTMQERVEEIESMISSTNTMKYTLMVFAVLLSVVVLYNLSLLNMKERSRDMATLKVLGYTHFQIALSLVLEIMTITVISTAIGCVLGYPLLWLVMTINEISVMSFVVTLYPVSYVLSVLISLGTALAINAVCGFKIAKIDMTESLKSVE